MKSIRLVVFLLALYALTLTASAATLVILNKSEHTASLIDPDTGKTLAKLPVGRAVYEEFYKAEFTSEARKKNNV
jgi:hypothetical protein